MFTATMIYEFKKRDFEKGCNFWQEEIFKYASTQRGFVRMQFLVNAPKAMAIGTWHNKTCAKDFLATGVFKRLLDKIKPLLVGLPSQSTWELLYFEEAKREK